MTLILSKTNPDSSDLKEKYRFDCSLVKLEKIQLYGQDDAVSNEGIAGNFPFYQKSNAITAF